MREAYVSLGRNAMRRLVLVTAAVGHAVALPPQVDTFSGKSVVPASMKHLFEPPSGKESCKSVRGQMEADDAWCQNNCQMAPPNCPKNLCDCPGGNPDMSPQSPAENEARRVFAQREAQVHINDKAVAEHEKEREAQQAVMDKRDMERVEEANHRVEEANHRVQSIDQQREEADKHRLEQQEEWKRLEREKEGKLDPGPSPAPDARYDDNKRLQEINDRVQKENERVAEADRERERRDREKERKDRESRERERILQQRVASRSFMPSPAPGSLSDGGKPLDTQCKALDGTPARSKWCQNSCNNYPPMCPNTICVCEDAERASNLTPAEPAQSPVNASAQPAGPTSSPLVQPAAPSAPTESSAVIADRVAKRNAEIQKAEQARKKAEHSRKVLEAKNRKALEAESRKEMERRRDALEAEQKQRTDENEQRREAEEAKRLREAEHSRKALEEKAREALDTVQQGVPVAAREVEPSPSPIWNIWAALRRNEAEAGATASPSPAAALSSPAPVAAAAAPATAPAAASAPAVSPSAHPVIAHSPDDGYDALAMAMARASKVLAGVRPNPSSSPSPAWGH